MRRIRLLALLPALLLALALMGCKPALREDGTAAVSAQTDSPTQAPPTDTPEGDRPDGTAPTEATPSASGFSAVTLEGETVDASLLAASELTMLNVWATFCSPCLAEMPDLGAIARSYADGGEVRIVGVVSDTLSRDGSINEAVVEKARGQIEATGADYVHLLPSEYLITELLSDMMYVPTTVFLNSAGEQVGEWVIGSNSESDWRAIIEERLTQVRGG